MMKTKIKRGVMLIALAIMSCLVFGLVACAKPEPSEPVLSGLSITNKTELTAEWHVGDADRTITVALTPDSFTTGNTEITVSSSGTAVTVDPEDKFKLHAAETGTATVTVTAGDFTDSVEITVSRAVPPLGGIAINATQLAAEWYIGEADRSVTVTYDPTSDYNAGNTPATVASSKPEVVKVDGMTLKAVSVGTAEITVTAGGKTATADITVKPVLTDVEIAGVDEAKYYKGDEITVTDLSVTLSPNGIEEEYIDDLTFEITSSDEAIAEIVKNETTQLPEKISFVDTGEVTVTVRFFVDGNDRAGEASKVITKTIAVVGVSFADSEKFTLAVGEKQTRIATATPDTKTVVYSVKGGSSDIITVNETTGEVTAVAVGTATVVATVQGYDYATAEYEVEVIAALSNITVTNANTFDSDIDYGSENIELVITPDNDYTYDSAQISVIASDTEYVSVINSEGKYYAVINKITYGTEKSNGVTIEIKSDRFTNVQTVTLNVKVTATAPVIELASEAEIQAFAGDTVALPAINKSAKCDGDVAPTVTVKNGETEVADAYNAQNNTLTIAEQGEDYTVTYSLADDRAAQPLTASKTVNVKLYRKVFKAVTGRKVYDYPEAVLDFEYGNNAKFVADENQTVSIQETNAVLGQFNMAASKYYYAEATFTLKNPSGDSFVGLSHSLPVTSGTPTRWLAAMVDRGDRNFKIKDIDMTDTTGKDNGNPDCFNYNKKDVLYRNQLVNYGGLTDSDAKTVKVAVARADEYFYTFVNEQFVMVNTDKDYSEPTVPGIFGIKLGDSEAGVTIGSISWIEGQDATNTKLNELYIDKYYGYNVWGGQNPSFTKTDDGFSIPTDADADAIYGSDASGDWMKGGITPYVIFDGDFKVEYDYVNTQAKYNAVCYSRGALFNVMSALNHTDGGQKQVMAATGLRIVIVADHESDNNVIYHGSPAMQENGVPHSLKDVDLTGDGDNQAQFTDNNYTSKKPYTTLAVHNNDKIHFSVERRLKSDHAEYTMKITVGGNTVTRVMNVTACTVYENNVSKWDDPVMFMWANQSNYGTVSNVVWQTISA